MDYELSTLIGERINTLLAQQDRKQKDLAAYLGMEKAENTISYFCSGKRTPNTSQLKKIAEFFHVSSDYLLGLSESSSVDPRFEETGLNDLSLRMLKVYHDVSKKPRYNANNELLYDFEENASEILNLFIGDPLFDVVLISVTHIVSMITTKGIEWLKPNDYMEIIGARTSADRSYSMLLDAIIQTLTGKTYHEITADIVAETNRIHETLRELNYGNDPKA